MPNVIVPPWIPDGLYQIWLTAYQDAGGKAGGAAAEIHAAEQMRSDPAYDTYFPGIRRDDGSIRFGDNPEQTYFSNIEAFRGIVEGLGMRPDVFNNEYIALIEGDTSPNEFQSRVSALEARVMSQGPGIRDWYAENYGLNMTNQGILASLMSERIDQAVLSRQITMAEIGGEGVSRGFDLSSEFVSMLAQEGMNREEADRLFGSAEAMLPALNALAVRHGDPDDDFDITEFAGGEYLDDPEQAARINRLKAQESSVFTGGGAVDFTRSRESGGVSGLIDV